ncbi:hypothetical protein Q8A73_012652 [Channa argus]|nr:hypothetical protein Q8A73_012652 [Channa argus]
MAVNSSSSSLPSLHHCSSSTATFDVATAFDITHICLLLPLSLLILYLGLQQWRKQRSFAATSHFDIFIYNSAALELIYVLGTMFYYCANFLGLSEMMIVGIYLTSFVIPGETFFHMLTCGERYLAVVHPVTYQGLRHLEGVRIRNLFIGCVWLLCLGWMGPGDMAGAKGRLDQSKQRAFCTITVITWVLWLSFIGFLVCVALDSSHLLSYNPSGMAGNSAAFLHYFHHCSDATFGFIIAIVFNVAKFSLHLPPSRPIPGSPTMVAATTGRDRGILFALLWKFQTC